MRVRKVFNRSKSLSSDGEASISIQIFLNGKYYYVNTAQRTIPMCWDKVTLTVTKRDPMHTAKNIFIERTFNSIIDIYNKIVVAGREVTIEEIKEHIKGNHSEITFNDFYKENIEYSRMGKISHGSYVDRLQTMNLLNSFDSEITFRDLNAKFILKFRTFLEKKKYSPNTISKHLKNVRTMTFLAKLHGYILDGLMHDPFSGIKITPIKSTKKFSLTFVQVEEIKSLGYTKEDGKIFDVWNMFLFSCRTAFRISDVLTFKRKHVTLTDEGYLIKKDPKKTGAGTYRSNLTTIKDVFGDNIAEEILLYYMEGKYENNLIFPRISLSSIALFLQQIFERVQTEKKVSFHIARHTCATHMAAKDVGLHKIMRVGGWTDPRTIQNYIDLADDLLGR